jgi:8-oxo-dGTP pyrophosphatase MutT (NUDIX family)
VTGEQVQRRPGPGEERNSGPATVPREAATVILLRDGETGVEVLLVRRSPEARFMADVWVFPGGSVERDEQTSEDGHRLAALRELREEAGVTLAAGAELVAFSRWITPAQVKTRFDTYFFLAELPADQDVEVDGEECVEYRWCTPEAALTALDADEIKLVFPTIKHLEQLTGFASVAELMQHARESEVLPVEPRVILDNGTPRVLLPGEPGY